MGIKDAIDNHDIPGGLANGSQGNVVGSAEFEGAKAFAPKTVQKYTSGSNIGGSFPEQHLTPPRTSLNRSLSATCSRASQKACRRREFEAAFASHSTQRATQPVIERNLLKNVTEDRFFPRR